MANPWIICPQPNPAARLKLFCLHHAGGSAWMFRPWLLRPAPELEISAAQLPGHDARRAEPLCTDLPALVGRLADALEPLLDRPWGLFGHSMGALLAHELAHELGRRGRVPAGLWLAAHRAPGVGRAAPIHQLPDDLFAEAIQRLGGTPDEVLAHPELLELFLPVLRADFALLETYDPPSPGTLRVPLACPLTVFGGEQDHLVSPAQLAPWRACASGRFRLKLYPGGHFFFGAEEAGLLDEVLADWRAAG